MLRQLYPTGTFTGNYQPSGDIEQADSLIVFTFGFGPNQSPGASNESLADFAVGLRQNLGSIALLATKEVSLAINEPIDLVMDSDLVGWSGVGTGTWGELQQAKQFLDQNNLDRTIVVAQSYHVGRVAAQAAKLDIDPIVPEGLPSNFTPNSIQSWTRNRLQWTIRTVPGNLVLALQDKL